MEMMLNEIREKEDAQSSVIVFGEIFGPGIQDMHYGQKGLAYRIFDISVDGKYLDKTADQDIIAINIDTKQHIILQKGEKIPDTIPVKFSDIKRVLNAELSFRKRWTFVLLSEFTTVENCLVIKRSEEHTSELQSP